MIRKFVTVPGFRVVRMLIWMTILAGATTAHAQQTPAQPPSAQQQPPAAQQPDSQQTSSQEISAEETMPGHKPKVKDYKNWVFNVGGGANLTSGTTETFVRGGGGVAAAGVARNYNKYFGLRADFQWDNLPLRDSALQLAQAPSATSHVYTLMLGPIVNLPLPRGWGAYIVGGVSFLHRSGNLDSSTAIPGSACNTFFDWWGTCFNASLPLNKQFLSTSQNQFGENLGFGVTYKIRQNVDLYGEWRYVHGKRSGITTDFRSITIGVRW
jgi:opacity protein-like surface antigen